MKKFTIVATAVVTVVLIGTGLLALRHFPGNKLVEITTSENNKTATSSKHTYNSSVTKGNQKIKKSAVFSDNSIESKPNRSLNLNRNSITFLVNKEYSLPENYVPKHMVVPNVEFNVVNFEQRKLMRKEAANALEKLFNAASVEGYYLVGVSAYRSYSRQHQIFINNIVTRGKEHTLKYSAVPGTSEHQTGLSIDITSRSLHDRLDTTFASTPEGVWIADNAQKYGFIIRYPKDKEDITGYAYEPWHIRYVGVRLANYLYENDMTLDEYYRYKPSRNFDFEAQYASLINFRPTPVPTRIPLPTVTPTPVPSPTIDPKENKNITITPTPKITPIVKHKNITPTPVPSVTPKADPVESDPIDSEITSNQGNSEMSNE